MRSNVNKMMKLAMLAAIGLMLMLLIRFPIIPAAPFLEYEPGDVPALIGSFLFGPVAGLIITAIISLLQAITVSIGSGWIGAIMHLISTGTMVILAGLIYRKVHTLKGAIIALAVGSLSMTLVMIPLNLLFTTLFLGVPIETVKAMLLPIIIPFNLFKAIANSAITVLVYKAVGRALNVQMNLPIEENKA